jgi:hypothetical protein
MMKVKGETTLLPENEARDILGMGEVYEQC